MKMELNRLRPKMSRPHSGEQLGMQLNIHHSHSICHHWGHGVICCRGFCTVGVHRRSAPAWSLLSKGPDDGDHPPFAGGLPPSDHPLGAHAAAAGGEAIPHS